MEVIDVLQSHIFPQVLNVPVGTYLSCSLMSVHAELKT